MGELSDRWFDQFSADWWDVTTTRGLIGGVVGGLLNLVLFLLLTAFGAAVAGVQFDSGPGASTPAFWLAVFVGGAAGLAYVRLGTVDAVRRFWRTFSGRAVTNVIKYGGYWALLFVAPFLAFFGGISFAFGRVVAHVGLFLVARVRHDRPAA